MQVLAGQLYLSSPSAELELRPSKEKAGSNRPDYADYECTDRAQVLRRGWHRFHVHREYPRSQ